MRYFDIPTAGFQTPRRSLSGQKWVRNWGFRKYKIGPNLRSNSYSPFYVLIVSTFQKILFSNFQKISEFSKSAKFPIFYYNCRHIFVPPPFNSTSGPRLSWMRLEVCKNLVLIMKVIGWEKLKVGCLILHGMWVLCLHGRI